MAKNSDAQSLNLLAYPSDHSKPEASMSINKINTRTLGESGLQVSELGLGTAAMAGNHRPDRKKIIAVQLKRRLMAVLLF